MAIIDNQTSVQKNSKWKCLLFTILVVAISSLSALAGNISLILISIALSAGLFSVIMILRPQLVLLAVVLPVSIVYAITQDVILAMFAAAHLPLGASIAYGFMRNKTRSSTTVLGGVWTVLYLIAIYAVIIIRMYGAISFDAIEQYINYNIDLFRTMINDMKATYASLQPELNIEKYLSEDFIEAYISTLKYTLLGLGGLIVSLSSLVSGYILKYNAVHAGMISKNDWKFTLSRIGGIVFFIVYMIGIFGGNSQVIAFIVNTFCLTMYPAVILMGVRKVMAFLYGMGKASAMKILILVLFVVFFSTYLIQILLIAGIFGTVFPDKNEEKV